MKKQMETKAAELASEPFNWDNAEKLRTLREAADIMGIDVNFPNVYEFMFYNDDDMIEAYDGSMHPSCFGLSRMGFTMEQARDKAIQYVFSHPEDGRSLEYTRIEWYINDAY